MNRRKSERLFSLARTMIPGGVNSPVRAFKAVNGSPAFITEARDCRLIDADGNEYIDYIGSWGPMILGHAHPAVIEALQAASSKGTSYGTPTPAEIELAGEIIERVSSVEKIRFVNSGTEATMSAIRLARAATERDLIIKFSGGYHGHADSFLIKAGSGVATMSLPDSPGVTRGAAADTLTVPYNDLEQVYAVLERESQWIAAVIVEPVAGNMGVVPQENGFLEGLRNACDKYGVLLIFDEVMTGFRVARGGAQELYGVKPDLTTFGKVIGGGLPVGAYGGAEELMALVAPEGPVYQAGTLSGNPLAMNAGLETLRQLDDEAYDYLEKTSQKLEKGLVESAHQAGIPATVQRVGSMLTLFFTGNPVKCFEDASRADHNAFSRFFHHMLESGIHLPPSGYEAWFVSLAHDEDAIDTTIELARQSLMKMNTE